MNLALDDALIVMDLINNIIIQNLMKKFYEIIIVFVSLLTCADRLQGQGTVTKPDQLQLIKRFINNWKGETGKDTTALWEIKSYGSGIECNFRYVANGKTFMEGKQHWEYDKKGDKFILSSNTAGMETGSLWFTSGDKCIIIPSVDMPNPEEEQFEIETEFKSADRFIQKTIVNKKVVNTVIYDRVKN